MSAELTMQLDYHNGRGITVSTVEGDVYVETHAEDRDAADDATRSLRPDEARALADALLHFAAEATR